MGNTYVFSGQMSGPLTIGSGSAIVVDFGGTATDITVTSGGELFELGVGNNATLESGGTLFMEGGGVENSALVSNGATLEFIDGGKAIDTVVSGGAIAGVGVDAVTSGVDLFDSGSEDVESGGVAYSTTVNSGAHLIAEVDATLSNSIVTNGGFLVVRGSGVAIGTVVSDGGGEYVNQGGVASSTVVSSGGQEIVSAGGTASLVTLSGGTLEVQGGGSATGGIVFAAGASATLRIDAATMPTASISGFGTGDAILLESLPASVTYDSATHVATVAGGETIAFAAAGAPSALDYDPATGMLTAADTPPCFAAGTLIATERGAIPVEHLCVGDRALLARGGSARIIWLGHRRVACARHPRPWDVLPVRVRAGAFGPGVPTRDLILSPGHAVHLGGVLIPVCRLLNGATVAQERVDAVTYWHVELPAHDVLLAEGLAVESYLDTGNRGDFSNGGPVVRAHPDFARGVWEREGCAPLVIEGPAVSRAKGLLGRRAASLGYRRTSSAALRVVADRTVLQVEREGRHCHVSLPPGVQSVRLRSRAFVPAQMRAATDDTRVLGVAVARVWRDGRLLALDDPALAEGWHAPEDGWRWTDGDGGIQAHGARQLSFVLALVGSYWLLPGSDRRARAAG